MDQYPLGDTPQPAEGLPLPQPFTPPEINYPPMAAPHPGRAPRRGARRWLLASGVTAALLLVMGAGVLAGSQGLTAQAASGNIVSELGLLAGAPSAGPHGPKGGPGGFRGPHGPGRGGELTVSSVSGSTITAKDPRGKTITVKVASNATYTRLGKTVSASAVTAGVTIHVRGTRNSDGSLTATRIDIEVPSYGGQVTAVSASTITVKDRQGTSHTIHTSSSTTVERADTASSLSAIKVGDEIVAFGAKNSDGSLNAEQIDVRLPHAGGQITKVTSSAITVTGRDGASQTIHVTGSTRYVTITMGANGPTRTTTTLSALKAGVHVNAEGVKNSDGSLTAAVVTIMPNPPAGGAHGGPGGPGGPLGGPNDQPPAGGSNSPSGANAN